MNHRLTEHRIRIRLRRSAGSSEEKPAPVEGVSSACAWVASSPCVARFCSSTSRASRFSRMVSKSTTTAASIRMETARNSAE